MEALLMYDTAAGDYGPVPNDAQAVAPYMDRRYRNVDAARARFPRLFAAGLVVTITAGSGDADIVDWEPGNQNPSPRGWYQQQHGRGRWRPGFYADLSDMKNAILPSLEGLLGSLGPPGPNRPVRIWTAHPTGRQHICGPSTCGGLPIDADGTQFWFTSIQGHWPGSHGDVDVSLVRRDFFYSKPDPPHPKPPEGTMSIALERNNDGRLEAAVHLQDGTVKHCWQTTPGGPWLGQDPNDRSKEAEWMPLGNPGK